MIFGGMDIPTMWKTCPPFTIYLIILGLITTIINFACNYILFNNLANIANKTYG